jgi:Fis family transcriptional regulator
VNDENTQRLDQALVNSLNIYFEQLGDQKPHALHEMVLEAIEKPLIRYVLEKTHGNLSKTAEMLGLSRNTLRKKMNQYRIQSEI